MKENKFKNIITKIESILPMTLNSFIIFLFIIYLFFIVGRSIWTNYNSNKEIETQRDKIIAMEKEIVLLENQNNYYQTTSYKEKEAREKLGFKGIGEKVVSIPLDKKEEKNADSSLGEVEIKIPNYRLWWKYYFE